MKRRDFFALSLGLATAMTAAIPDATASRRLRVLVATNEPWGTYHIKSLLDEAAKATPSTRWEIASVVPDRAGLKPGDPVPALTLDEAKRWGAHLLVVNGATDWPTRVVSQLPGLPVVASSTAYLTALEAAGARTIRPHLVAMTAGAPREAEVFAAHFGVSSKRVLVVGNPALDDIPQYTPTPGTVLIATSVTHPSASGGAAPGAQVLLDTAAQLSAIGKHVRVGLHPREDASLWSAYDIATEGTLAASATAEVTIGIPGSVFPSIAAVGCPLVGVVAPGLATPQYILDLCAQVATVEQAVAAANAKWRPVPAALAQAVGPLGGSGDRLWKVWRKSALPAAKPTAIGA